MMPASSIPAKTCTKGNKITTTPGIVERVSSA
jgi:hypothetical protein